MAINFGGTRYDRSREQNPAPAPAPQAETPAKTGGAPANSNFNRYIGYDNEKDFTELLISLDRKSVV